MKKIFLIFILFITAIGICFRIFCGIFVIQPIGSIPDGATIIYWRSSLNLPFISSADGLLEESGVGVSLLGRGLFLSKLAEPIKEREICRFGYFETIYLWSTKGIQYEK